MFRIIAGGVFGFDSFQIARAAYHAGYSGLINLESVDDKEHVRRLLDSMVLSHAEFIVAAPACTPELLAILSPYTTRGLKEVLLTEPSSGLAKPITGLKKLGIRPLVQVMSLEEALAAEKAGAECLVIKGNEGGGLVGEETTLILIQRIAPKVSIPFLARGGIGTHTAAACVVGGASGVVLDWQLALCEESDLPGEVRARVARMDGSETAILGQNSAWRYRAYARPGETAYFELKEIEERTIHPGNTAAELLEWKHAVETRVQTKQLLLIGQDAAFAGRLAAEYKTVKGICDSIRIETFGHIRMARQHNPIRESGPLAQSHGTRYPILQGPMTRVSDRAPFAVAVAEGGGLPFLALALMRASQVRPLLEETRRTAGDRPWGVGILGFVPKELREEQLAEVLKVRPPYAIIAGGRPDQAKALEQEGIHTYLHVPSPELLRMFLESGARRVIFEGRECGGHVGPRTSFVLWELMIQTILTHLGGSQDRPADYHIVFAGGIHDAVSAAMVAALAAPLSEKGVRVGVLLGTGYLFTEEAVESGAIVEGFQREAVNCGETILLESGVGHATRCAKTPFGDLFAGEKVRLKRDGHSKEEIREALEMLNLGRLRIASKGITREDQPSNGATNYVEIDGEKQRLDGMYMIGQVAALREKICTIADLHADVCRAAAYLDAVSEKLFQQQLESLAKKSPGLRPDIDIAIVGMSCVFPKADDVTTYWQNILNKVSAIEEIPKGRWDVDLYFETDRRAFDKIYSRWGGFIGPVVFDPARYGMPPNSVPSVDPLQLLMLELTNRALTDAGYSSRPFDRENTSVIVGVGGGTGELGLGYGFRSMLPHFVTEAGGTTEDARQMIQDCDHILPTWTEDSFAGLLLNVVAGRVANRLDLGGTNYSVDAACATSLAAVRLAVTELESRSSNVVVAAGADTMNTPFSYLCFSKTQALSPTGQCRTFDETADGIVISEGVAVAICKRLEDAIRDGDQVYAVIKSVGASSDGKDKGLTAPRPIGQIRALERAYTKAAVPPDTVGLIEAHGTGTVVGDRTEVESMTRFFEQSGSAKQSCALGSVKSIVGHTKCTAGMAGLVKAALALQHKVLPPTMGVTKPNSKANFGNGPFYLNTETRPWIQRQDGTPRRAGVSAFGFGGTNFHTVMEEAPVSDIWPEPKPAIRDWPAELFIWKAGSADVIVKALQQLSSALENGAQPSLYDLAAAIYWEHGRTNGGKCLAIIASTLDDLKSKIEIAIASLKKGEASLRDPRGVYYSAEQIAAQGKVAFLFPGQGSQRPDMLADLAVAIPSVREVFEKADQSLGSSALGKTLSSFIFPPPSFTEEERREKETAIKQTNVAQPAVGAADMAVYRLLASLGILPHMAAGHSYGEFVALCAAGSISFEELIRISEARGRFIIEAAKDELGTMAAVDADESIVAPVINGIEGVVIANLNSPLQTVISGTNQGVTEAVKRLSQKNVTARQIAVSCAFHSPLVAGAKDTLGQALAAAMISPPVIPVFSNATGAPHSNEPDVIRTQLREHLVKPVRFVDELNAMYNSGARVFVEVGPGRILTGLVERTLGGRPLMTVTMDQPGRHGLVNLLHALGTLATAGVSFHTHHLFEGRVERKLDLTKLVEQTKPKPLSPTSWVIENGRALPANGRSKAGAAESQAEQSVKKTWQPANGTYRASTSESVETVAPGPVVPSAEVPRTTVPSPLPTGPALTAAPAKPAPSTPKPAAAKVPASSGRGSVPQSKLDRAMHGHNQLMARFLETQRNVMLAYLKGSNGNGTKHEKRPPVHASEVAAVTTPAPAVQVEILPRMVNAPAPLMPAAVAASHVPVERATAPEQPSITIKEIVPPAAASVPAHEAPKENVLTRLVALVSERTGYPTEMLGIDLDLEADLGVDSIKRVEILSALQNESNAAGSLEGAIEELSKLKTLRAIAEWIEGKAEAQSTSPSLALRNETKALPAAPKAGTAALPGSEDFPVSRMLVTAVDAPLMIEPERLPLTGLVLITDDGAVAGVLAEQLNQRGVTARVIDAAAFIDYDATSKAVDEIRRKHGRVSTLIHLSSLADSRSLAPQAWQGRLDKDLKSLYNLVRCLETDLRKENESGRVLAATRMGGRFAIPSPHASPRSADFWPGNAAVCGFLKSVAREWPELWCRAVDFEFEAGTTAIAASLLSELTSRKGLTEVGYQNGVRKTLQSVLSPLTANETGLELQRESVVFITGGARGITAAIAVALAQRFQCKLILAGRSALPAAAESAVTAGFLDAKPLKAALLKQAEQAGQPFTPASIESGYRKLSQEREMRSNLSAMSSAGSLVEYHSIDVTDATALGALIDDVYKRHGRIDGVIHGAGIIEDKLLRDKTPASFDRVIQPKVAGAIALIARLHPETLRFLVFFSSVSARYGNRGQCDYAAANEVLDKLAWWLNARWPGRVLSINWGPWKTENGMVSSALASQFAKAGVQLIDPGNGQKIFVNELLFGKKAEAEVVWGGPIFHTAAEGKESVSLSSPLLKGGTQIQENSEGSLVMVRETTPAVDVYLEHHRLDGKPVLPMAMVLELFAEVAAAARPGKYVGRIRDLRLLRGVVFEENSPQKLRVQAAGSGDGSLDLKLETAPGRGIHYSAKAELVNNANSRGTQDPGLELEGVVSLPLSIPEIYENWLFHGPSFAGIQRIDAIGKNGILAWLKPSVPFEFFSYKPREKWLIDPVLVDSALQLLIVWARHFLDATPLPSKLGTCHVFGVPAASSPVRCEVRVSHQPGSQTLRADLRFFDEENHMFVRLEDMEVTFSKSLNRLGGALATAGGSH